MCQSSTGELSSSSHLPITRGTLSDCLTHFQLSPFLFRPKLPHVCSSKSTLICACAASIHLYLIPLPFLLSPTLWGGRKMRAASANYDYAHSKGPSLDLPFLRCQVCKLNVMIDSKLSNVTVSTCSNAYSLKLKKCAFAIWGWFEAQKNFMSIVQHYITSEIEISQRSLAVIIIMFSASHFCYTFFKSIEGALFVWNVSMQKSLKMSFLSLFFSSKTTHFFAPWSHR